MPNEDFFYPFVAYGPPQLIDLAVLKGCFDYMKEPWSFSELLFRINSVVRFGNCSGDEGKDLYVSGNYLWYRSVSVVLSVGEARILGMLINNTGKPVSREALFYALWGKLPEGGSRIIDMYVSLLRKKLKLLKRKTANNIGIKIKSVRGVGYILLQGVPIHK